MNNKTLLKSFITAPEEFCSFYSSLQQLAFRAKRSHDLVHNTYRSGCEKDYFVIAENPIGYPLRWYLRSPSAFKSILVPIYNWQYKQYLLNLRSKTIKAHKDGLRRKLQADYRLRIPKSGCFTPWKASQEHKVLYANNDIIISIYSIKTKQCLIRFNPFVLINERKNYGLTVSKVKEGVIKSLPF